MPPLLMRLFKHPAQPHQFVASRSQPGMQTCKLCRVRRWPGR